MVIKRVGVLSLAKLLGVLYGGMGLIFGCLFALFSLVGGGAMMASGEAGAAGGSALMAGLGVFAVVVFPIMYGALGFIAGLITGWLFNLAARFAGGLQLETE